MIIFPKTIRGKIREISYTVAVLPDGTIMLHKLKQIKDPKEALKEFQKLPKVKKSISKIKKEIEGEAFRSVR